MISFDIGHSRQRLSLDEPVLSHLSRHRQTRIWHPEAGGLLFARLSLPTIEVCAITGPRRGDRRGRYSYWPDEKAEQREINDMFVRDLHFIGCWHTHPEDVAAPSHIDICNTTDCVKRSRHALNGFIMVIVGRNEIPGGMCVYVCDKSTVYKLSSSRGTIASVGDANARDHPE